MTYIPKSNTNNKPDYRDFHFAVTDLVTSIVDYYNLLPEADPNFIREMKGGAVRFGFATDNLQLLNNSQQTEYLITVRHDPNDMNNNDNSRVGMYHANTFDVVYQLTIRTLDVTIGTDYACNDQTMRLTKMLERLEKNLTEDPFVYVKAPNTINYLGKVQETLSSKTVQITCTSNKLSGKPFITEESINQTNFKTAVIAICFNIKQQNN